MSTEKKIILGLDLGTNSIGWALIDQNFDEKYGKILGMGSRIIPMTQDVLGKFEQGNSISQTAERTRLRGIRRLRERHLLRRERLHRVLNILGFLPPHYSGCIDFDKRLGQFLPENEVKIAYDKDGNFIFRESFEEMLADFQLHQPTLVANGKKVPYDWTIYYLRKKAITHKIDNYELAWLLLHFNQKRGYYQLRGEEIEEKNNKLEEYYSLKVVDVVADAPQKGKADIWYSLILENGWVYRRQSKTPLLDWKDKTRDFIVTTDLNEDGSVKKDKEGKEKRSFRAPDENDWQLLKKKTENEVARSEKTVGAYIYDALIGNPAQKIKGKLVRTIERRFYKEELSLILQKQMALNPVLQNAALYRACIEGLYPHNASQQSLLYGKDFCHLFTEDILFYQRPLKSKKDTISNCPLEHRVYMDGGERKTEPIKCIPRSHPLYQEFRLWQWINNLRIINKATDENETALLLTNTEDYAKLFRFLNDRKEINQATLLKYFKKKDTAYRWNYVEDKTYPCNETHAAIADRLLRIPGVNEYFLTAEKEMHLWHIIYSVTDKVEYEKALKSFAAKNGLDVAAFYEVFKRYPPYTATYGAYSVKAIKKLLPLLRMGSYWDAQAIDDKTLDRIDKLIHAEFDESIRERVREKAINLTEVHHFQGLPEWLAKYVVYDRHAERGSTGKWRTPEDVEEYLRKFRQHALKNPIVEQVLTETVRVVKDVWRHYGNGAENFFDEIHVELGRDLKNPAGVREDISKKNATNEATNLRIKALLAELMNDGEVENVRPYSPVQQEILKIYEDAVLNDAIEIPEDIAKISKMAQPSGKDLQRYKLWLEQKYRSPYTGEVISLNKLFTPAYEIEHIIPQSRFFDDSFSNKVICEAAVNKLKDNKTGLEFIQECGGEIVELGWGKKATILKEQEYIAFVKDHYAGNWGKKQKLLLVDIPEKMAERQMNDTRYISRFVMEILSNLVRADANDDGVNSKNVLAANGQITTRLKQDWGLDAVWNELILPRFERLNTVTNTNHFTVYNQRYQKYLPSLPLDLQKGFQKKRIDHRHHAMDALVIACATRSHINYLNNQNALDKRKTKEEKERSRQDLRKKLCIKKYNEGTTSDYQWVFTQPWPAFVTDAKSSLTETLVTFKQNLRIINKSVNYYKHLSDEGKKDKKQTKGDNWAIRKPLHKDTVSGRVLLQREKIVPLSVALGQPKNIKDKLLRKYVADLLAKGWDKPKITKHFKEKELMFEGYSVAQVPILVWDDTNVASRTVLDTTFTAKKVEESITDTGIQKILLRHLALNNNNPEVAFSPEGIEDMNKNMLLLNNGRQHKPILKVRTYETMGNKYAVGQTGNKINKYVEAAKGTNLFFAVYADADGKRSFDTIPLNIVIERLKQGLLPVPEKNMDNHRLLFHLSPNDIVYIPYGDEDSMTGDENMLQKWPDRFYRFVSCTGREGHFVQNNYSVGIIGNEQGTNNKSERMQDFRNAPALLDEKGKPQMIKNVCLKINTDRIGNIIKVIK